MHYDLHYKSSRPERRKRSKRIMCSLLLLAALVKSWIGVLEWTGRSASAILFGAENATFKSNQPNLLIWVDSIFFIIFGACNMRRLKRALHRSIMMSHLKNSTAVKINIFCRSFSKPWIKICFALMPQYFVSGHVVWGKKFGPDKNWYRENLSHFFNELISFRGREFSEHF